MLGLFVKKPWSSFYKKGMKSWEIRSYPTDYRGDIFIIESKTKRANCFQAIRITIIGGL